MVVHTLAGMGCSGSCVAWCRCRDGEGSICLHILGMCGFGSMVVVLFVLVGNIRFVGMGFVVGGCICSLVVCCGMLWYVVVCCGMLWYVVV